ncbi:MAG TPA: hypothetical protein VGI14_10755 [Casimicrobiaceae bacterium]
MTALLGAGRDNGVETIARASRREPGSPGAFDVVQVVLVLSALLADACAAWTAIVAIVFPPLFGYA